MPKRGWHGGRGRGRGRGGGGRGGGHSRVPGICIHYNNPRKRCVKGDECEYIHICRYVFHEDGCRNGGCRRNHNFSEQPSRILQHFKINPNQDYQVLVELLWDRVNAQFAPRNPGEDAAEGNEDDEDQEYQKDDEGSYYGDDLGPTIRFPGTDDMEVEAGDGDGDEEDTLSSVSSTTSQSRNQNRRGGGRRRRQGRGRGRNRRASAASSMDRLSDTSEVHSNSTQEEKTEICTFHVKDRCRHGDECPRLHKTSKLPLPYQWQVRRGSQWMFFDENLNKRIEEAFCDPAMEKIDRVKVGRTSYTVDFDSRTMFQPKDSLQYQEIRRLCTLPTVFNQMKNMQRYCTHWIWYWEEQGRWQEYSKQNPPNKESLTDSDTLERAYHKFLHDENAKQIYPFTSRNFINFETMIHKVAGQRNLRICRRPKLYGAEMATSGASSTSGASTSRDERPNQRRNDRPGDRSTNADQDQTEKLKGQGKRELRSHQNSSTNPKEANLASTANMDYPRDGTSQQRMEDRGKASDHDATQKGNRQIKSGSGIHNKKSLDVRPKEPKPFIIKQTAKQKHTKAVKSSTSNNPNQNLPFAESIYREPVLEAVTAKPQKPASSTASSKTKQTYSEPALASFKFDVDDHSRSGKLETRPLQTNLSSRETETVKLIDIFDPHPDETKQDQTGDVFGTKAKTGRNIGPESVEGAEFVNTSYLEDLKRYLESDQDQKAETPEGTPKPEPVLETNVTYPTTHRIPKPAPVPNKTVTYPTTQETPKPVPVPSTNVTYPTTHGISKPAPVPNKTVTYPTTQETPKPVPVPSTNVTYPTTHGISKPAPVPSKNVTYLTTQETPKPLPMPSTNVTYPTTHGISKPAPVPSKNVTYLTTQETPKPLPMLSTNVTYPTTHGISKPAPVPNKTVTYPTTQETPKPVSVPSTNVTYPTTHGISKPAPVPSKNVTYLTTQETPKPLPMPSTNVTYPTTHGISKPAPVPSKNVTYLTTQETPKPVPMPSTNVTYPTTHGISKPAPVPSKSVTYLTTQETQKPVLVPSTNVTYPTTHGISKPAPVPSKTVTYPTTQETPKSVPVPSTYVTHPELQGTSKPASMPQKNITNATTQRTPKPVPMPRRNVAPTYQGIPNPLPVKSVTNLSSSNSASGQSILKPEPLAGLVSRNASTTSGSKPPEQQLMASATSLPIVPEQSVVKAAPVSDTIISGNQSSGRTISVQRPAPRGASLKAKNPIFLATPKSEVPRATPGCSENNVSEICAEYMADHCHAADCHKLHVKFVFQWQYKKGSTWKNFTDEANTMIERGFSNPVIEGITVTFWSDVERLVSFNSLTVSSDTVMGNDYVRRLSTISTVRYEEDWRLKAFCMEWKWYWKDENGNWIEYAQKNAKNYHSNVNANDLEIAYQNYLKKPSPATSMYPFETSHMQRYQLNFQTMRQQNIRYKTQREVLRRPGFVTKADRLKTARPRLDPLFGQGASPTSTERKQQAVGSRQNVPESWDMGKMSAENEHVLVPLDIAVHSDEYMKVADKFWHTMKGNIVAIKRVQNMELWEDFSIKRDRMTKKNKGRPVEEKLLWHGTNEKSCEAICRQNFDFRLSGSNVGTLYGQGSYFAREAKYSDKYSRKDGHIRRMFLVQVLVGHFTAGVKEYKRPPPRNPDEPLGDLYDSCVDNVLDPSIYVIFEKAQAYPEYLIEYRRSSGQTSPRHVSSVPRSSSVGNVNSSSVPYGGALGGTSARPSPSYRPTGSLRSSQPTSASSYSSPSGASRMSTSASSPSLRTTDSSTGQKSNASSDKKCIVQ